MRVRRAIVAGIIAGVAFSGLLQLSDPFGDQVVDRATWWAYATLMFGAMISVVGSIGLALTIMHYDRDSNGEYTPFVPILERRAAAETIA